MRDLTDEPGPARYRPAADDECEAGVRKRGKIAADTVSAPLLAIDRRAALHLQDQIRQRIVECVALGSLAPAQKLPSTRTLARQLKVSRNTVAAAYQKLVADGHLEARPRSGIYVSNVRYGANHRDWQRAAGEPTPVEPAVWLRQLGDSREIEDLMSVPPDWQQFPFPFVGSQLDRSLFPVAEWREASKLTLSLSEIGDWAADTANADDPKLMQEIRSKVLPRRGIHARPDEVLVTTDGQQALHLTVELLVERGHHRCGRGARKPGAGRAAAPARRRDRLPAGRPRGSRRRRAPRPLQRRLRLARLPAADWRPALGRAPRRTHGPGCQA